MKGYALALLGAGLCLAAAVGTAALGLLRDDGAVRPRLAGALPREIGEWQGEDLPLGDNEVKNAAARLLNYDDYIYRVYRRGGEEVFVYAMYWRQGSVSVREIAGHTPDGCWIANGARSTSSKERRSLQIGQATTAPAEVRRFTFPGGVEVHALWWHLWGDNLVDKGFDRKALMPTLRELWVWLGRRGGKPRDQLLVRIHARAEQARAIQSDAVRVFLHQFPEVFTASPL